jgi:hypothetical protein
MLFYFGENMDQAPKRCGKCKSKKLKPGQTNDVRVEDGHTLIRRVPKWTCKKCKVDNVMIHHMICEDALERWLEEPNEMTMQ